MTAYRVDDFEEEEDFDSSELEPEHRGIGDTDSAEISSSEDRSLLSEVVEPKLAETTRRKSIPIEVVTEKMNFKTKCQLMQEEIDNGMCVVTFFVNKNKRVVTTFKVFKET